jgi:teichuronic acid biosynthesis glycosyltransferase TuaC
MRVAVVTQYFPTSVQPWAGHTAYQTVRLLAQKCDLKVFYPEAVYPSWLTPASGRRAAIDRGWNPDGARVEYIPYPVLPVVSRSLNGFAMSRALLPAVRQFQPDVIFNYVVYPDGYAAVRIARALAVPVVLTAIGSDLNRIPDPLCGVWTRRALRAADGVLTVSHDLARTAVQMGARAETTEARLNGCDTLVFFPQDRGAARAALGIGAEEELILYVGRLDVRKGLVELIEAVAALRQTRPEVTAYVVGDGPDRPLLAEAIARVGAEEVVRLVPSRPTAEVARWMGAANLITLPSYMEGCPNVVIEALSSGRPVVATHVGGIPELMDERSGRLVPAKDVAALRAGLDEVLREKWDAEEIASRHSRSWGEFAAEVFGVLEKTVARYTPPFRRSESTSNK